MVTLVSSQSPAWHGQPLPLETSSYHHQIPFLCHYGRDQGSGYPEMLWNTGDVHPIALAPVFANNSVISQHLVLV